MSGTSCTRPTDCSINFTRTIEEPKWLFESFCGMWIFRPRSVRQAVAASCKIKGLDPRTAPELVDSTRILEEPKICCNNIY